MSAERPSAFDLVTGERSAAELDALLERLDSDRGLSLEVEVLADLAALHESGALPGAGRASSHVPARVPARRALLTAALLLVSGLAWLLVRASGGAPAIDRAPPRFVPALVRADGALDGAARLAEAMQPYGRGDWPAAVRALEALLAERPGNPPARFYLAAALEAQGERERAEELWAALAAEPHGLLARHARWRLALSAEAAGRVAQARAELEVLASTPGAFADDARELLPFVDEPAGSGGR